MNRFLLFTEVLALLLLLSYPNAGGAQWSIVQSGALEMSSGEGAATSIEGDLWLGARRLLKSTDLGVTWSTRAEWPQRVVAMHFYDRINGVIATQSQILRTTDGGDSWEVILGLGARGVGFCGSPNHIIVAVAFGSVQSTTDGGKTWKAQATDQWNHDVASLNNGVAYVMASPGSDPPSRIWKTTDAGSSWIRLSAELPYDIYSIAVDSCDHNIVYAMDEDWAGTDDGFSQVYQSMDAGGSWAVVTSEPRTYFNGAIYVSKQAVYDPSILAGIRRSTDAGATWSEIGGPGLHDDSRLFCSVNDSILIAVDASGSIWRTTNAGGFLFRPQIERGAVQMTPDFLRFDTSSVCSDTLFATVNLEGSNCRADLQIVSRGIDGSADFEIVQYPDPYSGRDSIRVAFIPRREGHHASTLNVSFSDGAQLKTRLEAFVVSGEDVALSSFDVQNDTIGGDITIPIRLAGGDGSSALEFIIRYDTTFLQYVGSFDLTGRPLDVGAQYGGTARIRVPPFLFVSEAEIGHARFKVYPRRVPCTVVTFDSIHVTGSPGNCLNVHFEKLDVNVCSASGCGVDILSDYVRYGVLAPTLTLNPNPARERLQVNRPRGGNAHWQIVNVTGNTLKEGNLSPDATSYEIVVHDLPAGRYVLILQSGEATSFGAFVKE